MHRRAGARAGRAAAPSGRAGQPGARLRRRRRGGDERRVRSGGEGREAHRLSLARGRQSDGAARRHGVLRCRRRTCTSCTPPRRASGRCAASSRRCSACRPRRSASSPRKSAAASACASTPTRNTARCCYAAKKLGRPVKWVGTRSEVFLGDEQARDIVHTRRAGARRERPHPRHALRLSLQHGRLRRLHRRGGQHARPGQRELRRLRRAGGARARPARAHQHRAHRRLPRRGPAGGVLCARAPRSTRRRASSASTRPSSAAAT